MRALVTGGTGFIGGRVVDTLLHHGYEVTALVRTPARAASLEERGVTLAPGDVTDIESVRAALKDQDSVFHIAAYYALGVSDRDQMFAINVGGTENVMNAALEAGTPKVLYCSSQAVLGSVAAGSIGDETTEHHGAFSSIYEESKWRAHQVVRDLGNRGLPVVTVLPCAVYGAGDTSFLGVLLRMYARKRLIVCSFRDTIVSWVHVDDVAEGMVAALERGSACEDYILGGDNESIGGLLDRLQPHTGIQPPRIWAPLSVMRASLPLGGVLSRLLGQEKGAIADGYRMLAEGSIGFSSAKAERQLGYTHRSVEEGMPPVIAAMAAE
jgi:dihydroflavonol-4-reductase